MPIYTTILTVTGVLVAFSYKLLPAAAVRIVLVPLAAAVLFVFADNALRAAAALMALDEQIRVRRFLSFRVFWKLVKAMPVLLVTQARSLWFFGPGWVVGDCLWPVICMVEKLSGKAAIQRSRDLMTGLRSAGCAGGPPFGAGSIRDCRRGQVGRLPLARWTDRAGECGYHRILVSCVCTLCRGPAVSVRPDGCQ